MSSFCQKTTFVETSPPIRDESLVENTFIFDRILYFLSQKSKTLRTKIIFKHLQQEHLYRKKKSNIFTE